MSHLPDLQVLEDGWIAVGWLHPDHPFVQADVSPTFLARIKEYAARSIASTRALSLPAAAGFHTCEFCGNAHGTLNFCVPTPERLYFSPEMIAHYIEHHRYAPPPAYIDAVMSGPLPGTREYVTAVAPYLSQLRTQSLRDPLSLTLDRHVALVLFEYLIHLAASEAFNATARAEKVAVWTVLADLEASLVEPFDPNYAQVLERARRLTRNYGVDETAT